MNRDKIVNYCKKYLKVDKFKDFCHNGLQVEGNENVNKIVTGVSISEELIDEAIKRKAEMIIVHHGIFKNHFESITIKGFLKNRLKKLLTNNINLVGFHLPLDAHEKIGNNFQIFQKIGLTNIDKFDDRTYGEIGFIGTLKKKINSRDFVKLIDKKLVTKSLAILAGPKNVEKVGVVSGGAGDDFKIAHELGVDTFITGEIKEHNFWEAQELQVNLIAAGHYNSERLGIKKLGEKISQKFKIKVDFIDLNCWV